MKTIDISIENQSSYFANPYSLNHILARIKQNQIQITIEFCFSFNQKILATVRFWMLNQSLFLAFFIRIFVISVIIND